MNALEREIEKGLEDAYKNAGQNAYFGNGFKAGANFILEKNLPILFAEWHAGPDLYYLEVGEQRDWTTKEAYDYWLNNVYGKY